jgi:DNA-binding response OmpR family regulator
MGAKKVLIVDDEPDISDSLKEIIETKGCRAFATVKSEEGWEIFQREKPDVCIMDIHMPFSKFDGVELLRKIRGIDKKVCCIFLTRIEDKEIKDTVDALGAAAYFEKPLSSEEFEKLMSYVV